MSSEHKLHINDAAHTVHDPAVTIIVVTFNAGIVLEHCLQSIMQQPFKNYQLLVFDGQSTDDTIDILHKYNKYISYWQSEPDKGIYDAMNKALSFVKGKWVYFLGADDELLPGFSKMAEHLHDAQTLYYGYCYMCGKRTNKRLTAYEVAKVNICHQAVFYPVQIFARYKYNIEYVVYADHALNIQCWGDQNIRKKFIPFGVAKFNHTGFSSFAADKVFEAQKPGWIKIHMSKYIYVRYLFRKWKAKQKRELNFR
ncbi:MAG: glycosyltransferase family 2 protein [Lacibacter sp.]